MTRFSGHAKRACAPVRTGLLGALLAFAGAGQGQAESANDKAWHHAREVLLSADHGISTWRTQKWIEPPGLIVMSGRESDKALVAAIVGQVNGALADASIHLHKTNLEKARIRIYFAPADQFHVIAAENGFDYFDGGVGYTGTWADSRHRIRAALVMIADHLTGPERQATVLQEICHAIGLTGHAPYFPASALFERSGTGSTATELAWIDRRLIRFLYEHVWPGSREGVLHAVFDRHWYAEE